MLPPTTAISSPCLLSAGGDGKLHVITYALATSNNYAFSVAATISLETVLSCLPSSSPCSSSSSSVSASSSVQSPSVSSSISDFASLLGSPSASQASVSSVSSTPSAPGSSCSTSSSLSSSSSALASALASAASSQSPVRASPASDVHTNTHDPKRSGGASKRLAPISRSYSVSSSSAAGATSYQSLLHSLAAHVHNRCVATGCDLSVFTCAFFVPLKCVSPIH